MTKQAVGNSKAPEVSPPVELNPLFFLSCKLTSKEVMEIFPLTSAGVEPKARYLSPACQSSGGGKAHDVASGCNGGTRGCPRLPPDRAGARGTADVISAAWEGANWLLATPWRTPCPGASHRPQRSPGATGLRWASADSRGAAAVTGWGSAGEGAALAAGTAERAALTFRVVSELFVLGNCQREPRSLVPAHRAT